MTGSLVFGLICVAVVAVLQTYKKGKSVFD